VADHPENEWVRRAVLSSATDCRRKLFEALTDNPTYVKSFPRLSKYRQITEELHEMIGAAGDEVEIQSALQSAIPSRGRRDRDDIALLRFAALNALGRGVARSSESMRDVLKKFDEQRGTRQGTPPLFDDAVYLARADAAATDLRLEAIKVLQYADIETARPVLDKLVHSSPLPEIRLAAIDVLAARDETAVRTSLTAALPGQTPAVRRRLIQSLLRTTSRAEALLAEIESGRLTVTELDAATVQLLINHKDEAIRDQARKLLAAAIPADRKQVLEKYQPALAIKAADAKRGRAVFEKNCVTCHKIGDLGVNVAPDISDSRTKTPAQLLNDILNPNQAIDNNYVSYTVVTKDGKTETGIVATETASSITLRQAEGKTVLILRQEIDELKSNGISLMPEGLEKNITVEQMADLISFIKNWRYLDGAVPVGK